MSNKYIFVNKKGIMCLLQACHRADGLHIGIKNVSALEFLPGWYTKPQRHQKLRAINRTTHNLVQKMHVSCNSFIM